MCEFCLYLLVFFLKFSYVGRWNLFVEGCLTTTPNSPPVLLEADGSWFSSLSSWFFFSTDVGLSGHLWLQRMCCSVFCLMCWTMSMSCMFLDPYTVLFLVLLVLLCPRWHRREKCSKAYFFQGQAQVKGLNCLYSWNFKTPDVFAGVIPGCRPELGFRWTTRATKQHGRGL